MTTQVQLKRRHRVYWVITCDMCGAEHETRTPGCRLCRTCNSLNSIRYAQAKNTQLYEERWQADVADARAWLATGLPWELILADLGCGAHAFYRRALRHGDAPDLLVSLRTAMPWAVGGTWYQDRQGASR